MWLTKVMIFFFLLISFCSRAVAQDNEYTFKISKLKTPSLYPDTVTCMQRDHKYKFVVRGASASSIRSIDVSMGVVLRKDSIVTVSIPDITGVNPDSCMLTIHFAPTARLDTHMLVRKFYIPAVLKKPRIPYIPTGAFQARWMHGALDDGHRRIIGFMYSYALHHVTKSTLTGLTDPTLWYQYNGGADSSYKKFDSIYVSLKTNKKSHRYMIRGSSLTPDVLQALETMHTGDRFRFKLYYKSPGTGTRQWENVYFKVSFMNYVQRVI